MNWSYQEPENTFEILPAGNYRVRISKIEETKSSTGKDMLKMTFDVSGKLSKLWFYLVFDTAYAGIVNQKLHSIYDSFGIEKGNMNFKSWEGKVGACKVRIVKDSNDQDKADIHYFLNQKQSIGIPAWVEPGSNNQNSNTGITDSLPSIDDGLQF